MANADGSVIFSCDLDSTKAQKKLSKLRDEISELNSKLEKETGNKMNLEKQLDAASQAAKATEERVKMLRKEVERLNDREWIQKQGFTQSEYQAQVLDRRAAAEAELKQQEELLHTQTKEVKTLSAAYEETTANIDSMTVLCCGTFPKNSSQASYKMSFAISIPGMIQSMPISTVMR